MDGSSKLKRLAEDIAAYLDGHPNAADTLEGICMWWLGPRWTANCTHDEVREALERLASAGRIVATLLPDGRIRYSLPKMR